MTTLGLHFVSWEVCKILDFCNFNVSKDFLQVIYSGSFKTIELDIKHVEYEF